MIKVLFIQESIGSGGVERTRLSLAKLLNKSQFELKIICTNSFGSFADKIRDNGVEVIEIGNLKSIFDYKQHQKVQRIIEDFKPYIIHGAVFEGVTMVAVNGFIKKVPIIIIEETSDPQNRSWRGNILMKLFSLVSDKVIAISPNVADYLTKTAKISNRKVITINNGVEIPRDVNNFEIEKLKKKYSIQPDDFIIGSIGRLFNHHKKYTDILEALAKLADIRIKLMIVGEGNDRKLIQNKATELKIENQLIMVGYQYDTAPFYKLMDVFCLASQREGFGLVAAEAMLHKLSVIATRVGGLQNVVKDNVTGYLVTPNSPDELCLKISELVSQPNLRHQMGEAGYSRALKNYTEENYVKKIENLYIDLLKQNKIFI
jgi:glycosyltransferase involved in cell wall biosynthesis